MLDDRQLAQIFLRKELINNETLERAQALCTETGKSLYHVLIEHSLVDEERAIVAVSKQLNLPCVSLKEFEPNPKILELVPMALAESFQLMPLGLTEEEGERKLYVAMANPLDLEAIEEVANQSGFPIVPLLAGPLDVVNAVANAYDQLGQQPIVEVEVEDGDASGALSGMFEGIFEDGMGLEEIMAEDTPDESKAPAKGDGKKPSFSLGIDFGSLDLSLPRNDGGGEPDPHTRSTLPAGTKLPEIVKGKPSTPADGALPPPVAEGATPPKPIESTAAAEAEAGIAGTVEADGAFNPFGDWGDLGLDDEPESSPPNPRHPAPISDNSNIRYVADANLRKRSSANDAFPNNIPVSDLIRATVRLLIKKRIMTEEEIKEELRLMRGQVQRSRRR